MANKEFKWEDNVDGKYYVDESCIASKFCVAAAPKNIRMQAGHAVVYKQPETPEEEAQVREAIAGCPVYAIGGDEND